MVLRRLQRSHSCTNHRTRRMRQNPVRDLTMRFRDEPGAVPSSWLVFGRACLEQIMTRRVTRGLAILASAHKCSTTHPTRDYSLTGPAQTSADRVVGACFLKRRGSKNSAMIITSEPDSKMTASTIGGQQGSFNALCQTKSG